MFCSFQVNVIPLLQYTFLKITFPCSQKAKQEYPPSLQKEWLYTFNIILSTREFLMTILKPIFQLISSKYICSTYLYFLTYNIITCVFFLIAQLLGQEHKRYIEMKKVSEKLPSLGFILSFSFLLYILQLTDPISSLLHPIPTLKTFWDSKQQK